MVDSEHLQIAQIALSERRAPSGRPVDVTSLLVMPLHPCQRRRSQTRITPGGAEVRFDNASVQAVRVLRRCDGSAVTREQREQRDHGSTEETRLARCSIRPPIKDDRDFHIYSRMMTATSGFWPFLLCSVRGSRSPEEPFVKRYEGLADFRGSTIERAGRGK
jgi:hypothetical protein